MESLAPPLLQQQLQPPCEPQFPRHTLPGKLAELTEPCCMGNPESSRSLYKADSRDETTDPAATRRTVDPHLAACFRIEPVADAARSVL